MKNYLDLAKMIKTEGQLSDNRTDINAVSIFDTHLKFDLREGFPLLTHKKMPFKTILKEVKWILSGCTNIASLVADGVHIWDQWAVTRADLDRRNILHSLPTDLAVLHSKLLNSGIFGTNEEVAIPVDYPHVCTHVLTEFLSIPVGADLSLTTTATDLDTSIPTLTAALIRANDYAFKPENPHNVIEGDLGPIYGAIWRGRHAGGVDQVAAVQDSIRNNPNSRRHIVEGWNPKYLPDESLSPQDNVFLGRSALAVCHKSMQFNCVTVDGVDYLDVRVDQRSADYLTGVPFNIAFYGAILVAMAASTDRIPRFLGMNFGDTHIYQNHITEGQYDTIVNRSTHKPPTCNIRSVKENIWDYDISDWVLEDYVSEESVSMGEIAV